MPYVFLVLVCLNAIYLGISLAYQPDSSSQKADVETSIQKIESTSNNEFIR